MIKRSEISNGIEYLVHLWEGSRYMDLNESKLTSTKSFCCHCCKHPISKERSKLINKKRVYWCMSCDSWAVGVYAIPAGTKATQTRRSGTSRPSIDLNVRINQRIDIPAFVQSWILFAYGAGMSGDKDKAERLLNQSTCGFLGLIEKKLINKMDAVNKAVRKSSMFGDERDEEYLKKRFVKSVLKQLARIERDDDSNFARDPSKAKAAASICLDRFTLKEGRCLGIFWRTLIDLVQDAERQADENGLRVSGLYHRIEGKKQERSELDNELITELRRHV